MPMNVEFPNDDVGRVSVEETSIVDEIVPDGKLIKKDE